MNEYLLSIDNIIVFLFIFKNMRISLKKQKKILLFGIITGLFLRIIFLYFSINMMEFIYSNVHIFFALGLLLILFGIKISNISNDYSMNNKFLKTLNNISTNSRIIITLIIIELIDIVFTLDSIPISISITANYILVIIANLFALYSLRSIYFIISHMINNLVIVKNIISIFLVYAGNKIIIENFAKIIYQYFII